MILISDERRVEHVHTHTRRTMMMIPAKVAGWVGRTVEIECGG